MSRFWSASLSKPLWICLHGTSWSVSPKGNCKSWTRGRINRRKWGREICSIAQPFSIQKELVFINFSLNKSNCWEGIELAFLLCWKASAEKIGNGVADASKRDLIPCSGAFLFIYVNGRACAFGIKYLQNAVSIKLTTCFWPEKQGHIFCSYSSELLLKVLQQ